MIDRLSPREKVAVAVAAIVVTLTIIIAGIIVPYRSAIARLDQRIVSRQEQLLEARTLVRRIQGMQGEVAIADRKLQGAAAAPLVSTLEGLVATIAGKEVFFAVRPQPATAPAGFRQEKVEMQLEKVRLDQLVRLLHALDTAKASLQTESVKMRPRFENPALLDVTLVISAFAKAA